MTEKRTEREDGLRSDKRRLARLELSQTWPSYLTGVLVAVFFGLFALFLLRVDQGQESGANSPAFLVDYGFLFLLVNLGVNWTSSRWMFVHRDPFTPRISFLRTLPIPLRDLISSRLMLILANTTVTSLAFFVPSYALFPILRAEVPPAQYLWFALFWVGYVLFSAGGLLFLEMGMKGVSALVGCVIWAVVLLAIVVLAQVVGVPLVGGSLWLVREYGPLVAIPALAAGGGCLILWCRLLEHRMRTRELAS